MPSSGDPRKPMPVIRSADATADAARKAVTDFLQVLFKTLMEVLKRPEKHLLRRILKQFGAHPAVGQTLRHPLEAREQP